MEKPFKRVESNDYIKTYNENDELHSYNDQPSAVYTDGTMLWHDNGVVVKQDLLPIYLEEDCIDNLDFLHY